MTQNLDRKESLKLFVKCIQILETKYIFQI